MLSEDYLREHKVKNIMFLTEQTMAPTLVLNFIDGYVIRVKMTKDMDINDVASIAENEVEDYVWMMLCKNRKRKLDKLFNKMKK